MILFRVRVLVFSLLFHLHDINGFSTVQQPLSLGRLNNVELFSSFHRLSSTAPVNEGSIFLQRKDCVRGLSKLSVTENNGNEAGEEIDAAAAAAAAALDKKLVKKLAGRKKRLTMGYQLSSIAYLALSL